MEPNLEIWTIYDHPLDYPDWFVVRRWVLTQPHECYLFESLEKARTFLSSKALVSLGRFGEDDTKIVETWI